MGSCGLELARCRRSHTRMRALAPGLLATFSTASDDEECEAKAKHPRFSPPKPRDALEMSSPSPTDWITAVGTIVAAVAAIATAIFALTAASTWKNALQNQRDDECVAAAINLQSAIHRCISANSA